jgi:retron-type reverse transcriptase
VISPLISNIYLHELDLVMESHDVKYVRYADDWVALCKSKEEARSVETSRRSI